MAVPTDFLATLSQVSRLLRTYCDQRFRRLDLTLARGRVMLQLAKARSTMTQTELTALLDVEHPTAVRLFDGLEQAHLIERRAVVGDRRAKEIVLTETGRPVAERVSIAIDEIAAAVVAGIDPGELAIADRVLTQILANIAGLAREADIRSAEVAQ
ncbi:MarR family transcriptional regulator, transcriptional regulator for hemolysin [Kaistia soli DSM 19436]|uniref:MarR family transcriptional regulator, transcriptional regulator for hemolysin n=1 Tax=Kaistia soli DSM 19436 TaxID=1122133 RepID=A0A1M4ZJP9_9HYPH|nr:MarR family transcriptional regulator [Kaistia soli]SHF18300.1 MarR family transcriptional regulator, transcriptional regulator for hemolysin [Kaistia soli DSM 19436]